MSPSNNYAIADDMLIGIVQIADYLRKPQRQAYYLCEKHYIPAFKLAGKWHLRKSTYVAHIVQLEVKASQSR
jgi:hypothetical protein